MYDRKFVHNPSQSHWAILKCTLGFFVDLTTRSTMLMLLLLFIIRHLPITCPYCQDFRYVIIINLTLHLWHIRTCALDLVKPNSTQITGLSTSLIQMDKTKLETSQCSNIQERITTPLVELKYAITFKATKEAIWLVQITHTLNQNQP